jgi:hypothetical protein
MLRELDLSRLPTPSSLLDAVVHICETAPEDPDYDPPRSTQTQLVALLDAVYRDGLP